MAQRTNRIASCTILSLGGETIIGLLPPLPPLPLSECFGISVLRAVLNWKLSSFSLSAIDAITSKDIPSKVSGTIPGVKFPGLLFMFSYASSSISLLQTSE